MKFFVGSRLPCSFFRTFFAGARCGWPKCIEIAFRTAGFPSERCAEQGEGREGVESEGGSSGSAAKCNLFAVARIKRAALTFD